jgi:radical SAM superfamily enzyme YgiQ (UPF0313 family)
MAVTWTWKDSGDPLYVSLSAGTLTLGFAGSANLSFDGEGRLVGAWLDGVTYRRALDNRILAKWLEPGKGQRRRRRFLELAERRELVERVYAMAREVLDGLNRGRLQGADADPSFLAAVREWLQAVDSWDWARLAAEEARFRAIYKPVSILPPDQYLSVVVQATEGCSYNECTFCTFYRDRPFRIKLLPELQKHMEQVREFLGKGIEMRRTLFLADANAVIIPQRILLPVMEAINRMFPVLSQTEPVQEQRRWKQAHSWYLDGIYAFISAPDALRKTPTDFHDLRERNLHRLYVGLETGHDPLRVFLRKPGTAQEVLDAVKTIKDGGVSVGLIFMVGVGGDRFREEHFRDTVALIQEMPLNRDDMLYVSPFVATPGAPYLHQIEEAHIRPLTDEEIWAEEGRFKAALLPWARSRGVKISRYDVREFVY